MDSTSPIVPPGIKEPDPDAIIWRYMRFEKLKDLILSEHLMFVSPWKFTDKSEGGYSSTNKQSVLKEITTADISLAENIFHNLHFMSEQISYLLCHNIYISCWHVADHESMAMWDLYAKQGKGIAIQTRYSKLKKYLNSNFYVGLVNYYSDEKLPSNSILWHFYKSKSFSYENEVRAIFIDNYNGILNLGNERNGIYHLEVKPEDLIEKIVVGPNTDKIILDQINELLTSTLIKIELSNYFETVSPKIHPILEAYIEVLKKHALPDCKKCKGRGYIDSVSKGSLRISKKFCNACKIHEKWESQIKSELLNIVK